MRPLACLALLLLLCFDVAAQEARRRWEMMSQIRREKFDYILPEALRENDIDMWIVMHREGHNDPLWLDLGQGYTGLTSYLVFSDPGQGRIERAAFGINGYLIEQGRTYDHFGSTDELLAYVAARDPQRIGINTSRHIGAADGLSHSGYQELTETLGAPYADRLVSAEKLVSDFRSRRVATELVAFGEAAEWSRKIAEQAFSNAVITPGMTTLEDVAWWMQEELLRHGFGSSFGMPSVYITGPDGIAALSSDRIIRRGDLLMIDWGVCLMNFCTDMKRIAYVLPEGVSEPPAGLQHAFEQARKARALVRGAIRAGITAQEAETAVYEALEAGGFARLPGFNQPTDTDATEVIIGSHSVGNTGHGIGPSIAFFNPVRMGYTLQPTNLLSIELFAYTKMPEWGGRKVRIPLEDDAVVTHRGVEWLYPVNDRLLLIK